MRRRTFIAAGTGALAWPLIGRTQQPLPLVGFLSSELPDVLTARLRAYRSGLGETGFTEGNNVAIEYRWAEGQYERLPMLAADLVRQEVAVIAANAPAVAVAKAATQTIPIVFFTGLDPVKAGLVASLGRPGGNLTGVSLLNTELVPKRIELLHELLPSSKRLGLLINPLNPNVDTVRRDAHIAARGLGVRLEVLQAIRESDFDEAFSTAEQNQVEGMAVGPDPLFTNYRERLARLAIRYKLPTIYQFREFAADGGLMSYSGSIMEAYRQIGIYTGRILKGEKAGDLPIQQLAKVELIINLRTARVLGLTVPPAILLRADEVIE